MGEKAGWVVGELLIMWLPWQPHQAIPRPQQLSGEAAAAGQGREQTCEQPQLHGGTLTGSNSSSGGTGSRAGPDVPTGLLLAPELLSWTCSLRAGSKGSVGDSPVPICSLRCDVWGYSRDEDVLCAGEHGLEEVAPTLSPYLGATSSHVSHKHFSILLFLPLRWCRFSRGKFSRPSSSGSGLCICVQPQQEMSDCKGGQAWVELGRCSHSCSQFPHPSVVSSGHRKSPKQPFPLWHGWAARKDPSTSPPGKSAAASSQLTTPSPSAQGPGEGTANTEKGVKSKPLQQLCQTPNPVLGEPIWNTSPHLRETPAAQGHSGLMKAASNGLSTSQIFIAKQVRQQGRQVSKTLKGES